jgi:hypothetical protein
MTVQVEMLTAFACEDVRLEFNGQMTFVGTVSSRFGAEAFPTKVALHIVSLARVLGQGRAEIEFQTVLNREVVLTAGSVEFELAVEDDGAVFPLGPSLGPFPSAGQVALEWRLKGEEVWQRMKVWDIEHVKSTTETDVHLLQDQSAATKSGTDGSD